MRKIVGLGVLVFITSIAFGQDNDAVQKLKSESEKTIKKDITDTSNWKWYKGGNVNVNGTQGSLKNWAAGGDKFALAINTYFNYFIFHRKGNINWDNTLDFNFGMLNTTSLGVRKNDDRIDLLSKYGYRLNGNWYLTGLFNFRSQLFNGYSYTDTSKTLNSAFLSPAYFLLSAGLDYKPTVNFSAFISPITSRMVLITNKELSAQGAYGVKPGKHTYNEVGSFASINLLQPIVTNVSYKMRLDLFSNYAHNPGNIDVFMANFISCRINKHFTASYNLDLIYDDDVRIFGKNGNSAGLQLKSLIGLGYSVKLN